jgi:hypothetical protein
VGVGRKEEEARYAHRIVGLDKREQAPAHIQIGNGDIGGIGDVRERKGRAVGPDQDVRAYYWQFD